MLCQRSQQLNKQQKRESQTLQSKITVLRPLNSGSGARISNTKYQIKFSISTKSKIQENFHQIIKEFSEETSEQIIFLITVRKEVITT